MGDLKIPPPLFFAKILQKGGIFNDTFWYAFKSFIHKRCTLWDIFGRFQKLLQNDTFSGLKGYFRTKNVRVRKRFLYLYVIFQKGTLFPRPLPLVVLKGTVWFSRQEFFLPPPNKKLKNNQKSVPFFSALRGIQLNRE